MELIPDKFFLVWSGFVLFFSFKKKKIAHQLMKRAVLTVQEQGNLTKNMENKDVELAH